VTRSAHTSVGAALGVANALQAAGHTTVGAAVHDAATAAFFHGFTAANLVAGGIAAVGAIIALVWLPAQPASRTADRDESAARAEATGVAAPAVTAAVDRAG
jgi:hypothetical protein